MPRSEKRKQRSHPFATGTILPSGVEEIVKHARELPIFECMLNASFPDEMGLARVLISRKQPSAKLVVGVFLVDMFCLGVKDVMCDANVSMNAYNQKLKPMAYTLDQPKPCPPELAHQIIYQGIDYAAKFEFKPHPDFNLAQYVLEERGKLPETYELEFGRDGKPLFFQGPYDDPQKIMAQLERTAGPGNYDFVSAVDQMNGAFPFDDFGYDDEDE